MLEGIKVHENWIKRYNTELMQLFRDLDILLCSESKDTSRVGR
jgi:hypothetical protein